jgi:hypothetical protein
MPIAEKKQAKVAVAKKPGREAVTEVLRSERPNDPTWRLQAYYYCLDISFALSSFGSAINSNVAQTTHKHPMA